MVGPPVLPVGHALTPIPSWGRSGDVRCMDSTSLLGFHRKFHSHRQKVESAISTYEFQKNDWSHNQKRFQVDRERQLEKAQQLQDQHSQRYKERLAQHDVTRMRSLPPISPRQVGVGSLNLKSRHDQANRIDKQNQIFVERLIQAGPSVRTARELENSYQKHAALVDKMSRLKRSAHDVSNLGSPPLQARPPQKWRSGRPAPRRNLRLPPLATPMDLDVSPAEHSESSKSSQAEAERVTAGAAARQYVDLLMGVVQVSLRKETRAVAKQYLKVLISEISRQHAQPEEEADDEQHYGDESDDDQHSEDEDFDSDHGEAVADDEQAEGNLAEASAVATALPGCDDDQHSEDEDFDSNHGEEVADDEQAEGMLAEVEDQDSKPSSAFTVIEWASRSQVSNPGELSNGFDREERSDDGTSFLKHREDDSSYSADFNVTLTNTGVLNISL
eukprot:TRINITY_DN1660_c0_g2_i1.p1 TRINITY_DN1660_c0_g2~~TRINITY_DN1660_c0_g2_i1.p1  ORF type:complete len:445 (-),score=78.43 TRINITY_DN1660_c0_g2_i1:141-1475(-)